MGFMFQVQQFGVYSHARLCGAYSRGSGRVSHQVRDVPTSGPSDADETLVDIAPEYTRLR